jgi:hypothetical protein
MSKLMNKQKIFKGDNNDKLRTRTKRACYNCSKYGHFIVTYPYERTDEDKYHKKYDGEAHIGQEWDSDEESSDSDSDATIAIKDSSFSSSKSLFLKLNNGKHTCLMAKKSKRKVKTKSSSSPKYVSRDCEDEEFLLNVMRKNPTARIKGLLKQIGLRDELVEE